MAKISGARSGASGESSTRRGVAKSTTTVLDKVKKVYKTVQHFSGAVGGYGHHGPVYGEITMVSFQKIVNFLKDNCGLDTDSSFVDIGAGLGKPNFHVSIDPGVRVSYGIEVEELRWILSVQNWQGLRQRGQVANNLFMQHQDITELDSLNPFTHVYMFDVGFPPTVMVSIANAFNRSSTAKSFVCFKPEREIVERYGFAVRNVGQMTTRMHGSKETHMVYFYEATQSERRHQQTKITDSLHVQKKRKVEQDGVVKALTGAGGQPDKGKKIVDDEADETPRSKVTGTATGGKRVAAGKAKKGRESMHASLQHNLGMLAADKAEELDGWMLKNLENHFGGTRASRSSSRRAARGT